MMMGMGSGAWANIGSTLATFMLIWAFVDKLLPATFKTSVSFYAAKIAAFFNPYLHITIPEFTGEFLWRNEAFTAIDAYITDTSSNQAKRLKGEILKKKTVSLDNIKKNLSLTIDNDQEVMDTFEGSKIWWYSGMTIRTNTTSFSYYPTSEERRYYQLTFHSRDRKLVTDTYLPSVIAQGVAIGAKKKKKKLYTNNTTSSNESNGKLWSSVVFDHPATFETLAMDPAKKKEVLDDLSAFRNRKEYYTMIGKAWKRGYLLYGPPGTGKSTMIAAMANFMHYDVYDLELTAVGDNTELRKLLFDTSNKSIIVIEDIDCSLDLAGKRMIKDSSRGRRGDHDKKKGRSKVTLSGLLNFIDGLWSACGGERIIVFTTNHIEKLDPALIRRGRMDMHVELSFCSFNGFKVLAKNYLGIESHPMFEKIEELIGKVSITPADVAESLMPKGANNADAEPCLQNLVDVLLDIEATPATKEEIANIESEESEDAASDEVEDEEKTG